jgi:hypothetical protein
MTPMNKQMSRKKLESVWRTMGPVDYQRPSQYARVTTAVLGNGPAHPDHANYKSYEDYAAAIRDWERALAEYEKTYLSHTDATSTSRS